MVRFTANDVVVDDSDEEFILVGFANEEEGESLHFQRSHDFDEQDGQGQGGYGGVERVELHPNRVLVVVKGELAEVMGTSEFDIAFVLSPEEFQRLRDGLRVVFADFSSLVEVS